MTFEGGREENGSVIGSPHRFSNLLLDAASALGCRAALFSIFSTQLQTQSFPASQDDQSLYLSIASSNSYELRSSTLQHFSAAVDV